MLRSQKNLEEGKQRYLLYRYCVPKDMVRNVCGEVDAADLADEADLLTRGR